MENGEKGGRNFGIGVGKGAEVSTHRTYLEEKEKASLSEWINTFE